LSTYGKGDLFSWRLPSYLSSKICFNPSLVILHIHHWDPCRTKGA